MQYAQVRRQTLNFQVKYEQNTQMWQDLDCKWTLSTQVWRRTLITQVRIWTDYSSQNTYVKYPITQVRRYTKSTQVRRVSRSEYKNREPKSGYQHEILKSVDSYNIQSIQFYRWTQNPNSEDNHRVIKSEGKYRLLSQKDYSSKEMI